MGDQYWVVSWAMYGWAILFAAMVGFEAYTLWWNQSHPGKKANLSSYVAAFFRSGPKKLKYGAGSSVLIALFVYFLGHFLSWWG